MVNLVIMSQQYPIVFSELKSRVGIDDVAYSLGYWLDKRAGVGRYFELVLGDPRSPSDRIVVRNTPDKGGQFYFRRSGGKGDVVSFIRENISSFNAPGSNEWTRIANVLANMANMPVKVDNRHSQSTNGYVPQKFDPERYEARTVNPSEMPYILRKRGFDMNTVSAMGDRVLLVRDRRNTKYDGYNIGFPYTNPGNDALTGYEIRGSGSFKSKAAGTDSSHSAWIADFPQECPQLSRNVYFFESSFDAMAFYQMNRTRLNASPFTLVSVGGSFNPSMIESVMNRYPAAKAWDCFDNDTAGQLYSAALVKAVDKIDFSVFQIGNDVSVKFGQKDFQCPKEEFDFRKCAAELGMAYSVGHWKSPANFKDWNDCLLGKTIEPVAAMSKHQRNENLYERRMSSLKM